MLTLLNKEKAIIPKIVVESEEIFRQIISSDTWASLEESERKHLQTFLPNSEDYADKPANEEKFHEETVGAIFSRPSTYKHGDPVKNAYTQLQSDMLCAGGGCELAIITRFAVAWGGFWTPEVAKIRNKCRRLKKRHFKLHIKEYYKNLMEEIVVSRQRFLQRAYDGKDPLPIKPSPASSNALKDRARKRYKKILADISKECGDNGDLSSDDENRVLITPQSETIGRLELQTLLLQHQKRKAENANEPDLSTASISLADVVTRTNSGLKKPITPVGLTPLTTPKQNVQTPHNNKTASEPAKSAKPASSKKNKKSTSPNKTKDTSSSQAKPEKKLATKQVIFPRMSSYFSLIGYIFEDAEDKKCNLKMVEDSIRKWQKSKSSEACPWKMLYPSWTPLAIFALDYMSGMGTASQLADFTPLMEAHEKNTWTWTGPEYTNKNIILPLWDHWLDTLPQAMEPNGGNKYKKEDEDIERVDYVVAASTDEEKMEYRRQEKERFSKPYTCYTYNMHGYQSIAAPVKGIFKDSNVESAKAREHALLVSDRPAYVTILSLVRDAVARLPNGEGTRTEVCLLLRDSQYLNPEATDNQINSVVSGALDRLHAEKDPCVKFDAVNKVWLFLHRTRTVEELERLHHASGAALLAKKQLAKPNKLNKMRKLEKELHDKYIKPKQRKTDELANDKTQKSKSPQSSSKTTPTGKTSLKRKLPADSTLSPAAKQTDVKQTQADVVRQACLDNETLMATQALMLSGDDESELFGGAADRLLDMEQELASHDDLPSPMGFVGFQTVDKSNADQQLAAPAQSTDLPSTTDVPVVSSNETMVMSVNQTSNSHSTSESAPPKPSAQQLISSQILKQLSVEQQKQQMQKKLLQQQQAQKQKQQLHSQKLLLQHQRKQQQIQKQHMVQQQQIKQQQQQQPLQIILQQKQKQPQQIIVQQNQQQQQQPQIVQQKQQQLQQTIIKQTIPQQQTLTMATNNQQNQQLEQQKQKLVQQLLKNQQNKKKHLQQQMMKQQQHVEDQQNKNLLLSQQIQLQQLLPKMKVQQQQHQQQQSNSQGQQVKQLKDMKIVRRQLHRNQQLNNKSAATNETQVKPVAPASNLTQFIVSRVLQQNNKIGQPKAQNNAATTTTVVGGQRNPAMNQSNTVVVQQRNVLNQQNNVVVGQQKSLASQQNNGVGQQKSLLNQQNSTQQKSLPNQQNSGQAIRGTSQTQQAHFAVISPTAPQHPLRFVKAKGQQQNVMNQLTANTTALKKAPVAVASIQALLHAGAARAKNPAAVASSIRLQSPTGITGSIRLQSPTGGLAGNIRLKSPMNISAKIIAQQPPSALSANNKITYVPGGNVVIQKSTTSVAPLKITLPRAGFNIATSSSGANTPLRLPTNAPLAGARGVTSTSGGVRIRHVTPQDKKPQ